VSDEGEASLRSLIIRGGVHLSLRSGFVIAFSLMGVLVTTHVIGPAHYGAYVAAMAVHQYVLSLGQIGVGAYLIRGAAEIEDGDFDLASSFLLVLGIVAALIEAFGLARLGFLGGLGDAGRVLMLLAASLPLQMLAIPATARLDRDLDYHAVALVEVASQAFYFVIALPLAILGWGPWALATGWVLQQGLACILFHRAAHWVPRPRWSRAGLKKMLGYAIGYSAATWIWQLRGLVNPIVVGSLLGVEAVGFVNLAIRVVELLTFALGASRRLSMSALARLQNNRNRLRTAVAQGMELCVLAAGPLLILFAVAGGMLVTAVFGARWLPTFEVYPFIALGYLTNGVFGLQGSMLYVLRRNWDMALFHAVHVLLFGGSAYLLVRAFGLQGYGYAELVALLGYIVLYFLVRRRVGQVSYANVLPWYLTMALALALHRLGPWVTALPLAALLWPGTWQRMRGYLRLVTQPRAAPAE